MKPVGFTFIKHFAIALKVGKVGIEVRLVDPQSLENVDDAFGLLAQYPGTFGDVRDLSDVIKKSPGFFA